MNQVQENQIRWHVFFSGEVQAVGFRFTTYTIAPKLELTGWVKNLPDGRVEMEAQGSPEKVRELLSALKNHPPIRIEDYHIQEIPLIPNERTFLITG